MTEKSSTDIFSENYRIIKKNIEDAAKTSGRNPDDIILLAATKTVSYETVNFAINNGINYIGENKVQELLDKFPNITGNVKKHFIGHLQTNKVKYIVDKVDMIESVDSVHLAREIDKKCAALNKCMDILLEVNIGNETAKSGFSVNDLYNAVSEISNLKNVRVKGLMAIPPVCDNNEVKKYFQKMYELFVDIGTKNIDNISMTYLSMGMSADYVPAIECGANIVRLGTALFGARNY